MLANSSLFAEIITFTSQEEEELLGIIRNGEAMGIKPFNWAQKPPFPCTFRLSDHLLSASSRRW